MYHYQVINTIDNTIVLDSGRRRAFIGYPTPEVAYMAGLGSKNENRLSDLHKIITYNEEQPIEEYNGDESDKFLQ